MNTRRVRKPFTEEEDAAICKYAELGMTRAEIGERLGRDASSLHRRIRRLLGMGVVIAPANPNAPRPKNASIRRTLKKKSTWRSCLCCQQRFLSEGAHHRMCSLCRTKSLDCFSASAALLS